MENCHDSVHFFGGGDWSCCLKRSCINTERLVLQPKANEKAKQQQQQREQ